MSLTNCQWTLCNNPEEWRHNLHCSGRLQFTNCYFYPFMPGWNVHFHFQLFNVKCKWNMFLKTYKWYFNPLGTVYQTVANPDPEVRSGRRVHAACAYPSKKDQTFRSIFTTVTMQSLLFSCLMRGLRWGHESCHLHTVCNVYPSVCNDQVLKLPLRESGGIHPSTLVTHRASLSLSELLQQLSSYLWVLCRDCIWLPICREFYIHYKCLVHLFVYLLI